MRIDQITFTRFLAAVSIVIFHSGMEVYPFNTESFYFIFKQANVCVSYFFILSGFVMVIAYGDSYKIKPTEYLKSRLARIYPVYFVSILLVLILILTVNYPIDYKGMSLNLLAIQSWFPGRALSFNSPGWSLSVEAFFYLLFPFLFNKFYSNRSYKSLLIPILSIWLITQVIFHWMVYSGFYAASPIHEEISLYLPVIHLNEFLIGNLAGFFFKQKLSKKTGNYDLAILLTVIALLVVLRFPVGLNYHNGLLSLIFVPLILMIALNKGYLTRIANNKSFVFLGEISFGIYILQFPIFYWVGYLLERSHIYNDLLKFYLSLFILLTVSAISYVALETPLRRIINKKKLKPFSDQIPQILIKQGEDFEYENPLAKQPSYTEIK